MGVRFMTLTQGHTSKIKSKCTHTKNPCPSHNSSLPSSIWIIFHTIVVHNSSACHDLDPKSYLQGQGHIAHIPEIRIPAITLYCQIWWGWYFIYLLSMTQGLLWRGLGVYLSRYDMPSLFIYLLIDLIYFFLQSPKGGFYSISDDLSCSWQIWSLVIATIHHWLIVYKYAEATKSYTRDNHAWTWP